ncbi:MAG: hypothetical protein V4590_09585 [Bacteroidota bacterium]
MKSVTYQGILVLLLLALCGLTNCDKPNDPDTKKNLTFPTLATGNEGHIYIISPHANDRQIFDSFIKVSESEYKLVALSQDFKIDHIQLFKGTNNIKMSDYTFNEAKYPNADSAWISNAHLYDMSFRNARIINEDSIVAEFYNSHYFDTQTQQTLPDSGLFAIKITP